MTVPTATYQVQACFVVHQIVNIAAADTTMLAMTPLVFARVVSTPRQKAPSIGPQTIDAAVRPAVNTDPQPRATTAMRIRTMPHPEVHHCDSRSSVASEARPPVSGL